MLINPGRPACQAAGHKAEASPGSCIYIAAASVPLLVIITDSALSNRNERSDLKKKKSLGEWRLSKLGVPSPGWGPSAQQRKGTSRTPPGWRNPIPDYWE